MDVCAGTGLKQAQRQRHDIHDVMNLCQLRSSACDPFFSAANSRARLGSFPKDLLIKWTFQTEHRTAGRTWLKHLKRCGPESSRTFRVAVIHGNSHSVHVHVFIHLCSSLILFVLLLFVPRAAVMFVKWAP